MTSVLAQPLEVSPLPGRPHPALTGLVGPYVGYHQRLPSPGVHRGLPSSVLTVVFAFEEPVDAGWLRTPSGRASYWALASGLHTEPAEIRHQGLQCGIQLGLTPRGARMLFGLPMRALATEIVSLDGVLGSSAAGWHERLAEQPSWQLRYRALDELLLDLLRQHTDAVGPRSELTWSWARIQAGAGSGRVGDLAAEIGWSRRHLTECFKGEFGVTPKQLARVARFERSKDGLFARRPLADVAAVCGYADQAHLTREWQTMSGYSPREWQRVELPFLQDLDVAPRHDDPHEQ